MSSANEATETLESDIVGRLSDVIASNDLKPGDRLPSIRDLALQFGVKAGTVRDALFSAQGKGIVKVLSRVGSIVQSVEEPAGSLSFEPNAGQDFAEVVALQDQNLFHILETREALELTMVARASQRRELSELFRLRQILTDMASIPLEVESTEYAELDVEFHLEIGRLSGNSVMTSLLRTLLLEVRPHLDRIHWSNNQRSRTNTSHSQIYSALVAGDAQQARSEMQDHIRSAYNSLLDEMRHPPIMNDND